MTNETQIWTMDMEQRWRARCQEDSELSGLAHAADVTFALDIGTLHLLISFVEGVFAPVPNHEPEFTVAADLEDWRRFFSHEPESPFHGLFAMLMRVPSAQVAGDELTFAQHCQLVRRVLELGREVLTGQIRHDVSRHEHNALHNTVGRYLPITVGDAECRIYFEQSGHGQEVVFLHTAGADSRQYRHLMNDPVLQERYHMTALDLPWHGRSDALGPGLPGSYSLTTDLYAETVMAVVDALDLNSPMVVGSSMGGLICLELAYRHADQLSGVVACEASDQVPGRQTPWARHPKVNQSLFLPEWIDGLMAPQSPQRFRREVWWGYSQSGYGTFFGDISFYSGDWDARDRVADIDTNRCPVVMLTGAYDYSCTPEMSQATAAKIPGAVFRVMPRLGHFPMAENPPVFAEYLLRALDEIVART